MIAGARRRHLSGPTVAAGVLRAVVAGGLAVDAAIHLHLASTYQLAAPAGIGGGTLFRIQAVVAVVAAVAILVRAGRVVATAAFLVAAAALGAVLLFRYVDVPALGSVPSMYEPVWFPEKTLSAVAEALAAIAALGAFGLAARKRAATSGTTAGSRRAAQPAPTSTDR